MKTSNASLSLPWNLRTGSVSHLKGSFGYRGRRRPNGYLDLSRSPGDRLKLHVPEGRDANRRYVLELQGYCRKHPKTLIIMDNVEDPKLLNSDSILGSGVPPLA